MNALASSSTYVPPPKLPPGTRAIVRQRSKVTLHFPNPIEDACLGCGAERKPSPELRAAVRAKALALRNVDEMVFGELLGKWKPDQSSLPFWKGRKEGSLDIFSDNVVKGKLLNSMNGAGGLALLDFEGRGGWAAEAKSPWGGKDNGKHKIVLTWDPDSGTWDAEVNRTYGDISTLTYDSLTKKIYWGKLVFSKRGATKEHLYGR